ncbi:MAG: hypothetical protein RBU37_10920 [Myxococcota bacterium]|nr:hypothetical protein [Myxococcota bacterium]
MSALLGYLQRLGGPEDQANRPEAQSTRSPIDEKRPIDEKPNRQKGSALGGL